MMTLIGRDSKGNAISKTQYIHALYLTPTKNIRDQVTLLMFEVSSSIMFYQSQDPTNCELKFFCSYTFIEIVLYSTAYRQISAGMYEDCFG